MLFVRLGRADVVTARLFVLLGVWVASKVSRDTTRNVV